MDLQATISTSCRELEATAAMMGVNLKVDPDSVGDLEEVLLALRELQPDESAMTGATFMVGAYLGEILRTMRGGVWRRSAEGDLLLEVGLPNIFNQVSFSQDDKYFGGAYPNVQIWRTETIFS